MNAAGNLAPLGGFEPLTPWPRTGDGDTRAYRRMERWRLAHLIADSRQRQRELQLAGKPTSAEVAKQEAAIRRLLELRQGAQAK